ncbi:MAG TPA: MFS transporter [Methylomirabilota bacterium]|nr:MFS transporter [Methylomirabilota bacterium]
MQSRVFYGWWVALAFAVIVFLSTGIRFTVGPFLKPIVADLGTDRAGFSLVVSLSLFLYGAFMPLLGRLVDRFGARPVGLAGTLVLAGAVAATGQVTRLWQFGLVYGVGVALGLAATGHVVGSAVLSRWFVRRRATALSVLGGASMAGMSLLVPVSMWLILTIGWRTTYAVVALVLLVVIVPLLLWVVRESPEAMGLAPDGGPPLPPGGAGSAPERTGVARALQTLPFWQLSGGMFTCGFSMSLLAAHGIPMLTDHGYSPMLASWALGLLGASSMACAMLLGAIGDRIGRRPVLAWLYATRALLLAGLFLVHDSPGALLAVALLGGASMSGSLAMTSALTADIFGRFSVGSIFGLIFLVHQAGGAGGSWLGGLLFELTGGYGVAFAVAAAQLLAGALVSLAIDEHARAARWSPVAGGR